VSVDSDKAQPERPLPQSVDGDLHAVEAPNARFLLQLVMLPTLIMATLVVVWLLFSWIVHTDANPESLVRDLRKQHDLSWQKALTLANLLRDPEYEGLKRDAQLANELASVLQSQIDSGQTDANQIRLQSFLCRALGEFKVPDVLPVLIRAARGEIDHAAIDVRRSALEAIAVLATNIGPDTLRDDEELLDVVLAASSEYGEDAREKSRRDDLRTTAVFALGVIAGDRAIGRLECLLDDPYPNARYNAATGLARHGNVAAIPVLLEMLDPDNEFAVASEESDEGREWKHVVVLTNAIRAARQLAHKNPSSDLAQLKAALEHLVSSDVQRGVQIEARETLHALTSMQAENGSGYDG
jgi:HEAT repeat protein